MKIPQEFFQFSGEKALVIVSGTKEAKFYTASDGNFEELVSVKSPEIRYSDKEGFFAVKAKGENIRSGAVRNNVGMKEKKEFLAILKSECEKVKKESFDYTALMAPEHAVSEITNSLCFSKDKIKIVGKGNYLDRTPVELLKILTKSLRPLL
jgi:hypothetical protein